MREFDLIAKYFAPLASGDSSALGLKDDAALLPMRAGHQLVITKDAMIAGVHFIGDEAPGEIARKLLRVNLSDLAAMGATPYGYLLALMLPSGTDAAWIAAFALGLEADQKIYGITLLGGDTTRTKGPLCASVTMLGYVPQGQALKRSGAQAGDDVYVSGTLGDAAFGLKVAQGAQFSGPHADFLLARYRLPEPRVKLGETLRGVATSCMDISDGLVQDLGHIGAASGAGGRLEWSRIPLSEAAQAMQTQDGFIETVLAGGDDYELLFTAAPAARDAIQALAARLSIRLTRIGIITNASSVLVVDIHGEEIILARKGYSHF